MRAKPGIIIFQQQFSFTPGKPERETGFLLKKMCGCKYQQNLNISNMRLSDEFRKYEQIKKLRPMLKKNEIIS
jgi:hypothetical protein